MGKGAAAKSDFELLKIPDRQVDAINRVASVGLFEVNNINKIFSKSTGQCILETNTKYFM